MSEFLGLYGSRKVQGFPKNLIEDPEVSASTKWLCIYRKALYTEFLEKVALFCFCKTLTIDHISVFATVNSVESPIIQIKNCFVTQRNEILQLL